LIIIITGERICRWGWIVLNRDRCSRQRLERWYNFQKSVAYIIIMNGWRLD